MKISAKKFLDQKIKELAQCKAVWDIGGASGFQKELSAYRQYFSSNYKTLDIYERAKPDIVGDAHSLPFQDESVDGLIYFSVYEHLCNPFRAAFEMRRVLKMGGKVFIYLPFIHPYHGSDRKGDTDYWRFSKDGIQYLFRGFSSVEFVPVSGLFETMSFLLPRQHRFPFKYFVPLAKILDSISSRIQSGNQTFGYYIFLVK